MPPPALEWYEPSAFAAFGSFAAGVLELSKAYMRPGPRRRVVREVVPVALRLAVFPLFAAGLAFAYVRSGQPISPLLAIQVGASTPLIIQALGAVPPAATAPGR